MVPVSAVKDIAVGIAQLLADSGIGVHDVAGTHVWQPGEVGIFHKTMPPTPPAPERVIVITCTPLTDGTVQAQGIMHVQFKIRGTQADPFACEDIGDAIFDLIQNLTNWRIGTTMVTQVLRQNSFPTGIDQGNRWGRMDNYQFTMDYPNGAHRSPGGWD